MLVWPRLIPPPLSCSTACTLGLPSSLPCTFMVVTYVPGFPRPVDLQSSASPGLSKITRVPTPFSLCCAVVHDTPPLMSCVRCFAGRLMMEPVLYYDITGEENLAGDGNSKYNRAEAEAVIQVGGRAAIIIVIITILIISIVVAGHPFPPPASLADLFLCLWLVFCVGCCPFPGGRLSFDWWRTRGCLRRRLAL